MAGASLPQGKAGSRKRDLNAELNLVPFIDLLSMCICFLLITAVWVQTGAIQVKQTHGTSASAAADKKDSYEMEVLFTGPTSSEARRQSLLTLKLAVKRGGKTVHDIKLQAEKMDLLLKSLDEKVGSTLVAITKGSKLEAGSKPGSLVASAIITPREGVSYGDLVSVMDSLRNHDIINLGITPGKGK